MSSTATAPTQPDGPLDPGAGGETAADVPVTLAARSGLHDDAPVLPCAACGQAVTDATVREARDVTRVGATGQVIGPDATLDMGLCPECRERSARADAIVAAHPALVSVRGPGGARRVVGSALDALAAIAQPLPSADVPDRDLAALIHHLHLPGAMLAWRTWAAPNRASSDYAFAHLPPERLAEVRTAYGSYLHEKAMRGRPPIDLAPPEGSERAGCLFCGIATVRVAASRVARDGQEAVRSAVWRRCITSPRSLGVPNGPQRVLGYLCPACAEARDVERAVGPSTLARALVDHLRSTGRERAVRVLTEAAHNDARIEGLRGWGALPVGTPPNPEPWAHIDLSGIES